MDTNDQILKVFWCLHISSVTCSPRNQSHCEKHALNSTIHNPFSWIATATYQGKHEVPPHQELEIWGAHVSRDLNL